MNEVSVTRCESYDPGEVERAMREVLEPIGGLDWVRPGMKIGIKANMVTFMKPEGAATTHPEVLCALVRLLRERGATAVVGDSPGGLYTAAYVNRIYAATGMARVEAEGAALNRDFGETQISFPEAKAAKSFTCTSWLLKVDGIIDFCKLKSHGMMCMSAAVKNMFGAIPGTMKPEYHFRYPNEGDFANMLVDLNEYFKPRLAIADAIVGMEGNGPTAGKPKKIGALLASKSTYALDLVCAEVIGVTPDSVPTIGAAQARGLCPQSWRELTVHGALDSVRAVDFENILKCSSLRFQGKGTGVQKLAGIVLGKLLSSRPELHPDDCVGCELCFRTCPAKAIEMRAHRPVIDRKKCIRCFCCQEFARRERWSCTERRWPSCWIMEGKVHKSKAKKWGLPSAGRRVLFVIRWTMRAFPGNSFCIRVMKRAFRS